MEQIVEQVNVRKPVYSYAMDNDKLFKIVKRVDKYGVEREYKYNQSEYLKKFQDVHKDELRSRIQCSCGKSFAQWNKSHHVRSKYHLAKANSNDVIVDIE
jgi:hypothetical protein